jgi:hypothetical protein
MKQYKKEYIDLKQLKKLVPEELLPNINLLFNKDIPKEPNTADELIIYRLAQLNETEIQQYFHKQFNALACELKSLNRFNQLEFVQNDNGDSAGGRLTQGQRIALYRRKKAEGSRAGFPDISMLVFNQQLNLRDTFFCEVKRIGAPSEIHITQEQLDWFLKLNSMGFNAYITNNPTFFKKVILGQIKKMFI